MKRVERVVKSRKNIGLNANDILVAEFEYISQTVFQTNKYEERIGGFFNLVITVATASAGFLLNNQTFDKTLLFPFHNTNNSWHDSDRRTCPSARSMA